MTLRRPQTFGKVHTQRPLRSVARAREQLNSEFGQLRIPPQLDWGVTDFFDDPRGPMGQAKFLDGRTVFASGNAGPQFQQTPTDKVSVHAVDGLSRVAADPFPNPAADLRGCALGDGRVLFVAGMKAQTLEPAGLTWTVHADCPTDTAGCELIKLPSGNALRIGGASGTQDVQEFNQLTNVWTTRPNMPTARTNPLACVTSNGKVIVTEFGTIPDIYDPIAHTWSVAPNSLQASNYGQQMVTASDGFTYLMNTVFTGPLFSIITDRYNPVDGRYQPRDTHVNSWQGGSSDPGVIACFELGDGWILYLTPGLDRTSFFDFHKNKWFDEPSPGYPERWTGQNIVQLDKNTILTAGGVPVSGNDGIVLPHNPTRYVLRASSILNNKTPPTFGGLLSVVNGDLAGRVVLKWNPGSDDRTHPEDINYFVYFAFASGGQNFDNAQANTSAWAGTKSIALYNLSPDTDYYFVVRARDMVSAEIFINETTTPANFETNTTEILFHTALTIPAPTFGWIAGDPMTDPRAGVRAIQLASDIITDGDNGRVMVIGGIIDAGSDAPSQSADIYSQLGEYDERIIDIGTSRSQFGVIHGSPQTGRRGAYIGGKSANFNNYGLSDGARYFPYLRGFFSFNSGNIPPMPKYIAAPAVVGLDVHGALRAGGIARNNAFEDASDISFTTSTVDRMYADENGYRIQFDGATGTFTEGNTLTGGTSGATGIIRRVDQFVATGSLYVSDIVGFFTPAEIIDDGSVTATASFPQGNYLVYWWAARAGMYNKRSGASAITMDDGRVLVAGGANENGEPVRDVEIYDPALDSWTILPGYQISYNTATGAPAFLSETWVATDTFKYGFLKVDLPTGATGVLGFSTTTDAANLSGLAAGAVISDVNIAYSAMVGGAFATGDTITGLTSAATATIWAFPSMFPPLMVVGAITGTFSPGETIDNGLGVTATVGVITGTIKSAVTTSGRVEKVREHTNFPAVKLLNGDVLLIGGDFNFGGNSKVDQVNAVGTSVTPAADLPLSRRYHTAHVFGGGEVGVFGGLGSTAGTAIADVRLYDPGMGTWSHPADMNAARYDHASILLADNRIFVAGGYDSSGIPTNTTELSGT